MGAFVTYPDGNDKNTYLRYNHSIYIETKGMKKMVALNILVLSNDGLERSTNKSADNEVAPKAAIARLRIIMHDAVASFCLKRCPPSL